MNDATIPTSETSRSRGWSARTRMPTTDTTPKVRSAFAPGARVVDDGHEFRSSDEIRNCLTTAASEFTYTRTLVIAP